MKWFNNQKIFTKILLLVGGLSLITCGISYVGYKSASDINERSNEQGTAAQEVDKAHLLVESLLTLDGVTNDLPIVTTKERLASDNHDADEAKKAFADNLQKLYENADEDKKSRLQKIEDAYKAYVPVFNKVAALAATGDKDKTLAAGDASSAQFDPLKAVLQDFIDHATKTEQAADDAATATYEQSSKILIISSVAAVFFSMIGGYLLAVYGISKPTKALVSVLHKLINNELKVEVDGVDRKDEVGDIARAAENFKIALIKNNEYIAQLQSLDKSQAIIEFNMDGTVVNANENFIKTLGYSSVDEIKGRHHSIFVPADYRETPDYKNFWHNLGRGEAQIGEYKRISKTGKDVYIQASYCPILDLEGKPFKVVKFATDLTAAKMAEFARLAAEAKDQQEKEARANRMAQLVAEFDTNATQTVAMVSSASTQLAQTAEHMSGIAADANRQSTEVASASQQASQNVQSVASAAEEMAATVQEISRQVSLSNDIVREAMKKAETADASSRELVEMSSAVGAIADLIENIAGQINLLALNATIESARAGEAGKGFAVVANEVKNLATQTTKATEQIRTQLDGVQKTAVNVADILGGVKESIGKVSESSTTIAAAVEEQSAATHEIVSNMSTATLGVEQINKGIFSIKSGTETTSTSTGEVLDAAKMLSQQAERMDLEIKTFLRDIQTA